MCLEVACETARFLGQERENKEEPASQASLGDRLA